MEQTEQTHGQSVDELEGLQQQLARLKELDAENQQRVRTLEQRNRDLTFLIQAIQAIISTLRLEEVLSTVLEGVRQCLDVAACSVWLIDDETGGLVCRQAVGPQSDTVRGWRLEPGDGVAGWVAKSGQWVIVPDTRADDRHFKGVDRHIRMEMRSILSVPLRLKNNIIGALHVLDTNVNRFDESDLTLAESLAVVAAIAIENARLYEQAQQEIKERQRTEAALRESEERFRQVIVSVSAHIYVSQISRDGQRVNLYLSPNIEALTGYPPQKFMDDPGFWLSTVIHPEDRSAAAGQTAKLAAGKDCELEYRLVRADGQIVWVQDSARVETSGNTKTIYGVVSNITGRKQLEEQLYQSQKMEAVGLLAGGVAHNFNNLMTVITGYGELLQTRFEDDADAQHDIEQIRRAGKQAASLTKQLLAFSRKQVLQPTLLDLNLVVENMDRMLRPIIGEDIDLVIAPQNNLWPTKADPGQIEQVIMNLVINARDAMPHGGRLTIETANVYLNKAQTQRYVDMPPGEYVMVSVSDTGHGIDEKTMPHIFEPFYTTKEPGQGTGLGLATVHGIVKQSGGHIWVNSTPGEETTFQIYLPRAGGLSESASQEPGQATEAQGSETILLVEDENMVRELAYRVLLDEGYNVLVTRQGEEAVAVCRQNTDSIHLLITDVIMPGGMSGRELAEHLTLLRPEMKVLYITGYPDRAIGEHGILGADTALLQKPFTPTDLTRKVREVLDKG